MRQTNPAVHCRRANLHFGKDRWLSSTQGRANEPAKVSHAQQNPGKISPLIRHVSDAQRTRKTHYPHTRTRSRTRSVPCSDDTLRTCRAVSRRRRPPELRRKEGVINEHAGKQAEPGNNKNSDKTRTYCNRMKTLKTGER